MYTWTNFNGNPCNSCHPHWDKSIPKLWRIRHANSSNCDWPTLPNIYNFKVLWHDFHNKRAWLIVISVGLLRVRTACKHESDCVCLFMLALWQSGSDSPDRQPRTSLNSNPAIICCSFPILHSSVSLEFSIHCVLVTNIDSDLSWSLFYVLVYKVQCSL